MSPLDKEPIEQRYAALFQEALNQFLWHSDWIAWALIERMEGRVLARSRAMEAIAGAGALQQGASLGEALGLDEGALMALLEGARPGGEISIEARLSSGGARLLRCRIFHDEEAFLLVAHRSRDLDDDIQARLAQVQAQLMETNRTLSRRVKELEAARRTIEELSELVPICSFCKKVRDDDGFWGAVESFFAERDGTQFTHSLCPDCIEKHYPEFDEPEPEPE